MRRVAPEDAPGGIAKDRRRLLQKRELQKIDEAQRRAVHSGASYYLG
jgi:hypothetical protein